MLIKRLLGASLLGSFLMGSLPVIAAVGDLEFDVSSNTAVYASEHLSADGALPAYASLLIQRGTTSPTRRMEVVLLVRDGTSLGNGASGIVEFRLNHGVYFSRQQVVPTDLVWVNGGAAPQDDATLVVSIASGGNVGDSHVAFKVEANGLGTLAAGDTLTFNAYAVRGIDSRGVSVTISTRPDRAVSDGGNFRAIAALTAVDNNGNRISSFPIARFENRFRLVVGTPDPATAVINLDDRTMLVRQAGSVVPVFVTDSVVRNGLILAEVAVHNVNHEALSNDGRGPVVFSDGDRLQISVAGDLSSGGEYRLFLDINGDDRLDASEELSEDQAFFDYRVLRLLQTPSFRPVMRNLIYVPSGDIQLEPTSFVTTAMLDFNRTFLLDSSEMTFPVTIGFGAASAGFAMGVPNCTQTERAIIRVTNEGSGGAILFVQGYGQDGSNLGFEEVDLSVVRGSGGALISGGETLILATHDIERIFGLNSGSYALGNLCNRTEGKTWEGRAQLGFFSDGNLTIFSALSSGDGRVGELGDVTGLSIGDSVISR